MPQQHPYRFQSGWRWVLPYWRYSPQNVAVKHKEQASLQEE